MEGKLDKNFNLDTYLPLMHNLDHSSLILYSQQLLEIFEISAEIQLVECNSIAGLNQERCFRIMWWTNGDDPLRLALYQSKKSMYHQSLVFKKNEKLSKAWQDTEHVVRSTPWRKHLINLINKTTKSGESYLRLFFRTAQQIWSRAARWHAIMPSDLFSPFVPLIKLMAAGAWPLGCYGDTLWVFLWNEKAKDTIQFGPPLITPQRITQKDYIFLCFLFQDTGLTARWEKIFQDKGWNTTFGPVNENVAPPEVQLGKKIREARAVVGLLPEPDPDFGIPWWIYQELDYACACNRPAILVTQNNSSELELKHVKRINCALDDQLKIQEEHRLWRWLQKNAI